MLTINDFINDLMTGGKIRAEDSGCFGACDAFFSKSVVFSDLFLLSKMIKVFKHFLLRMPPHQIIFQCLKGAWKKDGERIYKGLGTGQRGIVVRPWPKVRHPWKDSSLDRTWSNLG